MGRYTDPERNGYLMEAKACAALEKDLTRLIEKYRKKVAKEQADRKAEFEEVMGYRSEAEIQEAYGWEFITEKQYDRYLEIFRKGKEALESQEKTVNELSLGILERIVASVDTDRREWEFCSLTPEEQAEERKKAEESQKRWKEMIAKIKNERNKKHQERQGVQLCTPFIVCKRLSVRQCRQPVRHRSPHGAR